MLVGRYLAKDSAHDLARTRLGQVRREEQVLGLGDRPDDLAHVCAQLGGEVEGSGDANASIAAKLPIAGMVILMLLVWQFNSLRKPTIVLATILFALVGVAIGLLTVHLLGLPGGYFGFMTLLGVVSLAGIVINNSQIEQVKVLVFRESRGWEVRHDFFTNQFKQASLKDNNRLDKTIDNISGATLSVRAIKKLAAIALLLDQQVQAKQ